MDPYLVAIRCPQCGAETDFPEGAHALRCAYCGVALRVLGAHRGGQARFLMLPTLEARALGAVLRRWAAEQQRRLASIEWQTLVLVPYWRARGIALRWVYYRPAGPPAPAGAAEAAVRFSRWTAAEAAASRATPRLGPGGRILRFVGEMITSIANGALDGNDGGGGFEGIGAGVPDGASPGSALDGRDLQTRHFDLSFPAFADGEIGLPSLGVRTGVRPLRVLAPDVMPAGARMLPLQVQSDRAMAQVTGRIAAQFDDAPGHTMIERQALVVGSLSAIYFPIWVATVRLDGAERCLVVDAVAGSVVREGDPSAEPWLTDLPGRTSPPLAGASVGFLPLKCPECAHDLPLEASAIAHLCTRCGRAFAESGNRLVAMPYDAVPARGAEVYLPAWRFEATLSVDGAPLRGASELPRLVKPVGWPMAPADPGAADRPVSLYVPAFECRDLGLVDRLGAALTRLQPAVGGGSGPEPIPLSPPPRVVGPSVDPADAEALARLLLVGLVPGAGPAARKRLESLEVTLAAPRLVWLPVDDRGGCLQDRLTGISLRKESLGWARDWSGTPAPRAGD